jgi:hypothetical protein
MRSEDCSSLRRTASGNGCEAVLLLLAALILACSSSGPTNFGLATVGLAAGGESFARGFEKFVRELGREGFAAAVTGLCSSDVLGAFFGPCRFDIVRGWGG